MCWGVGVQLPSALPGPTLPGPTLFRLLAPNPNPIPDPKPWP